MINARVGPLLKKFNIHQKKYFYCMKTYWISPGRRWSSSQICTKAKRRYTIYIYTNIYILPAFVVNNPTCTKPCITLSIEMVSREGGLWGRDQQVEEQLEEQGGRTRQLEKVSSLISQENSEILIYQRTNLTRSANLMEWMNAVDSSFI